MMEHLGLNTPYFGIGLSVILFLVGTYLFKNKWILLVCAIIFQYGWWHCIFKSDRHTI